MLPVSLERAGEQRCSLRSGEQAALLCRGWRFVEPVAEQSVFEGTKNYENSYDWWCGFCWFSPDTCLFECWT